MHTQHFEIVIITLFFSIHFFFSGKGNWCIEAKIPLVSTWIIDPKRQGKDNFVGNGLTIVELVGVDEHEDDEECGE